MMYGHDRTYHALRVCSTTWGAAHLDELVTKICSGLESLEDVLSWATTNASSCSIPIYRSLSIQENVKQIVTVEILKSFLYNSDAGSMQTMMLAGWLGRDINVHSTMPGIPQMRKFDPLPSSPRPLLEPLDILFVPSDYHRNPPVYNHYQPFPAFSDAERVLIENECAASYQDPTCCNGEGISQQVNWVMCDSCRRWYHMTCAGAKGKDDFFCGCNMKLDHKKLVMPAYPKTRLAAYVANKKHEIQDLCSKLISKKLPSWRYNILAKEAERRHLSTHMITLPFRMQMVCSSMSGISVLRESSTELVLDCVRNLREVSEDFAQFVLFPEVLIYLFMDLDKTTRLQAEQTLSTWKR
ncbi:unnamed protein product [Owenia fusiformis]|uniref:Uncharacterized protein n=1 Tax=Owenia fusiformis TaxID=6347 RepID=A0A8J1UL02_OWEFU|nr:unnamed protein product [Owenia fusiformis]